MEKFEWNPLKSERLKKTRGISFEELTQTRFIDIRKHPNREDQEILLFEYRNAIWVVPFVRSVDFWFLKTLYRSRKYTKMFQRGEL